jgi:hypothetical protein
MDADDLRSTRGQAVLGVQEFAAIEVGTEEYVVGFDVRPGVNRDDVLFSLGILRHSINQKIRQERMEGIFRQARQIQASILPRRVPVYGSFDIAGRSVPMETVGGDYYDYIRSPTRSWARDRRRPGQYRRRRCKCATSTWAADGWGATTRSCAPSSG